MGKLLDNLNKQLKTEFKQDAEDCLEIYNKLKERTGHVWESDWNPLTTVNFIGQHPYVRHYKPSAVGYIFLQGIRAPIGVDALDKV